MMLYVMIEAIYPIHTHSRSALYIYKVLSVSAPSTVATGHMDVAPARYMLSGT